MGSPVVQIPIRSHEQDASEAPYLDGVACQLEVLSKLAHELTQHIDVQIAAVRSLARERRRPFEEAGR